jgi:predicted metal-dependent hydrolase
LKRYTSRPFPPYRHEPGKTPHPERDPEGHLFGSETDAEDDDYFYAIDLFNAGYWWEAHVYWERLWSQSPAPDAAELLQGLIQLSAALVKRRAESPEGEAKLVAKALEKLMGIRERRGEVFMGVPLDPLIAQIKERAIPTIELRL